MQIVVSGPFAGNINLVFDEYELKLPFILAHEKDGFAAMLRKAAYKLDGVECVTRTSAIEAIDYCHENPGVDMRDVSLDTLEDVQ